MTSNMKKDFQKVVKMFRDQLPDVHYIDHWTKAECTCRPEYPKAMMTQQQERNRTATINFGRGEDARRTAEQFQTYKWFVIWCESYSVSGSVIELNPDNRYQVRVNY